MGFAHLHCHSAYSLLEGTATPQALVSAARRLKMPSLALTDRNNLYGVVPFYLHARKAGIRPVIGMEVELDDGFCLVLLARNFDGYRNLCHFATVLRLNSDPEDYLPAGFDEDEDGEIPPWDPGLWGVPVFGFSGRRKPEDRGQKSKVRNLKAKMAIAQLPGEVLLSGRHARGLIALSGGRRGLVNSLAMQGKTQQAARAAGMLLSAFGEGNFFVELTALDERDTAAIPSLVALADSLGLPIVAANDVLYLNPEDSRTADALAAARAGARGRLPAATMPLTTGEHAPSTGTRYLRAPDEMGVLFKEYPQAIANALYIAEQCDVELPLHKPLFPSVNMREEETAFSRLWKLCFAGAARLYKPLTDPVLSRLKYELEIIERLGFCPYFLVVYEIVRFARSRNIPIMARGSAADSLVAYVLGITQVDPLKHDLLFERFLNPSRAEFELPDIDLDLCWRRRDEVLHYVYEHFGRDHVAIVGTHITFRLRSAWREMAKALGIHPDRISRVAQRLPHLFSAEDIWGDGDIVPEMESVLGVGDYAESERTPDPRSPTPTPSFRDDREREAFELCRAIEGLPRHAGMHCAGVVISPGPIADLVPLQRAARDPSMAITQYDKDAIEAMGLVKMDLLGSRALTTLVDAVQASGLASGTSDIHAALGRIPFDDEQSYQLMADGNTLGCFQLESPGMRGLLKWLRPRNLNDVAAAISLFRPGPLEGGFLESFMRRHLQQEAVTYHHPSMEPILKDTYGVILYQEQFLKLAHALAGMDLGDAEKLRKELGKARSPEERTRLGSWFVAGAIERGIDQLQAERVWEIIAGYSGFGFCKAHACSYALTAYRTAYMKTHYPAQYMAAQINNQGGFYGPTVYIEDARRFHVEMLPPHVNLSGSMCEVPASNGGGKRAIRLGLQFVKGLSEKTIALLISERHSNGYFRSLPDLMTRVPMTPVEVSALIKVGACDDLDPGTAHSAIVPRLGTLGEPVVAVWETPLQLNRKQMLHILPALLSAPRRRASGAYAATGTDNLPLDQIAPVQLLLGGDFTPALGAPRILGRQQPRGDMHVPPLEDYTIEEKLRLEKEVLGFALSRNEMEVHAEALAAEGAIPSKELARYAGEVVAVGGIIVAGRRHLGKDGRWMLFLTLQDASGLVEVVLFSDAYQRHGETLANGGYGPYVVRGQVQVSGKGRGIGTQPPAEIMAAGLPAESVAMKMHPVVIAEEVRLLGGTDQQLPITAGT